MKKLILYILWMGLILPVTLLGQPNNIVPVSPEAAALAKMINYPVNLNTGIPDINIPLHEVKIGGLSLPIALQYHSGGFRINERSTRSGLGWSLSSDLQITRSVNGLDDFKAQDGYIANTLVKSMDTNHLTEDNVYPLNSVSPFPYRHSYDIAKGIKDGSPDKFNYKLLKKSGSFYFQKNTAGTGYTIVPVPYDDIKITYNQGVFTILDVDGTVYTFGTILDGSQHVTNRENYGLEYTGVIGYESCDDCVISAWKCKSIVNATSTSQIEFEYEKKEVTRYRTYQDKIEYFYNQQAPSASRPYYHSNQSPISNASSYEHLKNFLADIWSISTPKYKDYRTSGARFHVPYVDTNTGEAIDKSYPITDYLDHTRSDVAGIALKQITFNGGRIVFSGADKLSSITLYQGQNARLKEVKFIQSYTPPVYLQAAKDINGSSFQGTLYLDEIQISGKQDSAVEIYKLQYLDKECFGNHLKGHDVWGYRNASTLELASPDASGTSAVPAHVLSQKYYFNNSHFIDNVLFFFGGNSNHEMPSEQFMRKGVLSRITYPTKGYTKFNFEANKYKVQEGGGQSLRIGGGLRIKEILHYDAGGTAPVLQKHFKYGINEDGTGIAINPPASDRDSNGNINYKGFSYEQIISYLTGPNNVPGNGTPPFYPIPMPCYNRGCLHPVANESKTTYLPSSFLDFTYANGAPIYYTNVSEYNEESTQVQGKTEHIYYDPFEFYDSYIVIQPPESYVEGTNIRRLQTNGFMGMKKSESYYKNVGDSLTPVSKTEYTYIKYMRPEMVRVVYSFLRVEFIVVGGNFNGSDHNLYDQSQSLGTGSAPTDSYYVNNQYGIAVGKMLLSKVVDTNYDGAAPLVEQTDYFYDNQQYTQPSRIQVTDSKGLKLQRSYAYSYDRSGTVYQQMLSKNIISPVLEEMISYVSPAKQVSRQTTTWANFAVGSGLLAPALIERSERGGALFPIYTFSRYDSFGNLLEGKNKEGMNVAYIWGYGGQYPVAKIDNATYTEVSGILGTAAVNSLNALTVSDVTINNTINTLRNHANMRKAHVSSYTYKPLIGMTSKTDARGITEYYEYDNSGRLCIMKDSEGNILKTYCYNYKGQQVDCFGYVPPVPGPYQGMVSRVNSVIAEKLAIDPLSIVGVNRLIEDLGADELDYIEIIMDIEEEFDIEIPDVDLESLLTVGDIYEYLVIRLHILTYQGMVSRVNSVIAEKLAIDPLSIVGVNRLIEDLGADELDYIEIMMAIEEEFNIEIPDVDLASLLTVGDIYEYLGNVLKIDL